jgi:hypothetical protein
MKRSLFLPTWWVFLPTALPLAGLLWLRLGTWLDMQAGLSRLAAPTSSEVGWLWWGYDAIQHGIWIFLSPGGVLILQMVRSFNGTSTLPPNVFWLAVAFSVAIDCLLLYGVLLMFRWMRWAADQAETSEG